MLLKRYFPGLLLVLVLGGCNKEKFAELNTNPDAVLSVPPEYEFTTGVLNIHNRDFEYYYDYNRAIYYWAQTFVTMSGNSANVYTGTGNLNVRTSNFYENVGPKLADVLHLIDIMPADKKAKYAYIRAITTIPMAFYAWYVSDVQGSIAYTQAFKARYENLLTPQYDTQETLFDTLDNQLKRAVSVLQTTQPVDQTSLGNNDLYFGGDVTKWIKAANSLRLRIAMRLLKRNPTKLKTVATEVLADATGLINSSDDEWKFVSNTSFTGGNYNPASNSNVTGLKSVIDFMWQSKDPRIRVFYKESGINTKDKFDSAKAQGALVASDVWTGQTYQGQYGDPDASTDASKVMHTLQLVYNYLGVQQKVYFQSSVQNKLFYSGYEGEAGNTTFPVIMYSEVCLMRAELAARGITTENAEDWYNKGIDASLAAYNTMAQLSKLVNYVPITSDEIATYKQQPGVAYDASNALEQILAQQYLNFYKNQNEAWALIKRTGFPHTANSIFDFEVYHFGGTVNPMPRRFAVSYPSITDLNYNNVVSAIEAQQKDPYFGIPSDLTGRVWWDKGD